MATSDDAKAWCAELVEVGPGSRGGLQRWRLGRVWDTVGQHSTYRAEIVRMPEGRMNWANVFAAYQRPLGYEIRGLAITVADGVAFGHSLYRISGT